MRDTCKDLSGQPGIAAPHAQTRRLLESAIDGLPVASAVDLAPGTRPTLLLHVPPLTAPHLLRLQTAAEIELPGDDHRHRSVRLLNVRIAPAAAKTE